MADTYRVTYLDDWTGRWTFMKRLTTSGEWEMAEWDLRRYCTYAGDTRLMRISAPDCEVRYYRAGEQVDAPEWEPEKQRYRG